MQRVAEGVGVFGLLLLAFGLGGGAKAAQSGGMALMTLALLFVWPHAWYRFKSDVLVKVIGIWLLYVWVRAGLAAIEVPDLSAAHFDQARKMSKLSLVLLVAWWGGGTVRGMFTLYLVAFSGLLLAILFYVQWDDLGRVLSGPRMSLGINAQHVGLLFATAIAGWLLFAPRLLGIVGGWHAARRFALATAVLGWGGVLALLVQGLLLSQSRGAWIAMIVWLGAYLMYAVAQGLRRRGVANAARNAVLGAAALFMVGAVVYTQMDDLSQRMSDQVTTVQYAVTEGVEGMPLTSIGIRLHMWRMAIEWWAQRPVFGWGPGAVPQLLMDSGAPRAVRQHSHLHNSILELLVRTGLFGLALFGAFVVLLIRAVYVVRRRGHMPQDAAAFALSVLLLFLVVNFSEAYIDRQIGWVYIALFAGAPYSLMLWHQGMPGAGRPT